jgi:uncharacterized membrane protein
VGVALVSVISGWLLVHVIFALHYAHLFYARDTTSDAILAACSFPAAARLTTRTSSISPW